MKWISVDDGLPEENGKYMVRAIWGSLNREVREEPALFLHGRFQYGFDWCSITHWMPLPDPPEETE